MKAGDLFRRGILHIRRFGIAATVKKIWIKIFHTYFFWLRRNDTKKSELCRQEAEVWEEAVTFSIVVPVYRPDRKYFEAMLRSVQKQTYKKWELCLADGSGFGHTVKESVEAVFGDDPRVRYLELEDNLGISENTNAALAAAAGDYIVLGDHDDLFRPDALYECAKTLKEHPETELIYTDEDKYDSRRKKRIEPHLKPDFSPDLLRSTNYICHMLVFSRKLYEQYGGLRREYDGAQDYDLVLRYTEQTKKIVHIPKILYSWRCHAGSTAANPESKRYAYEAGLKALRAHLTRMQIKASVQMTEIPGYYRVIYELPENPLVSVIIPNKDHHRDLDACLRSIAGVQDYPHYEILVIENNSTEAETFSYYERITKEFPQVRVISYQGEFNYSAINNLGAENAKGAYLLLLNNDTKMIHKDCLKEMLRHALRPEVGIVGCRLLYGDDTIQHGGVVIGMGGVAGHAFAGLKAEHPGYFARAVITQNYSAVTAACLMVRKSVYDAVGGLEEKLRVAYNDVDFCLKVRAAGYLIVYDPYAELYHYESKSRGMEDTPEKAERFLKEGDYIIEKWKQYFVQGDPYFNRNLSLTHTDFSLREKNEDANVCRDPRNLRQHDLAKKA